MSEMDEMLPTGEAARVLGVHPQTLREYEKAGVIVARRLPGGYRRWRLGDLLQLRDSGNQVQVQESIEGEDDGQV